MTNKIETTQALALRPREWAVVVIIVAVVLAAWPMWWQEAETFQANGEFRLAEAYRDDYWLWEQ